MRLLLIMLVPFEINHAILFHLLPRDGRPPTPAFALAYGGFWVIVVVYLVAIPFTRHRQSVHGLIAKTVVRRVQ